MTSFRDQLRTSSYFSEREAILVEQDIDKCNHEHLLGFSTPQLKALSSVLSIPTSNRTHDQLAQSILEFTGCPDPDEAPLDQQEVYVKAIEWMSQCKRDELTFALKKGQLSRLCRQFDLPYSGTKLELATRLTDFKGCNCGFKDTCRVWAPRALMALLAVGAFIYASGAAADSRNRQIAATIPRFLRWAKPEFAPYYED